MALDVYAVVSAHQEQRRTPYTTRAVAGTSGGERALKLGIPVQDSQYAWPCISVTGVAGVSS